MSVYEILYKIMQMPDMPRYYRELRDFYHRHNKHDDAAAIASLLEGKFTENDEIKTICDETLSTSP